MLQIKVCNMVHVQMAGDGKKERLVLQVEINNV